MARTIFKFPKDLDTVDSCLQSLYTKLSEIMPFEQTSNKYNVRVVRGEYQIMTPLNENRIERLDILQDRESKGKA